MLRRLPKRLGTTSSYQYKVQLQNMGSLFDSHRTPQNKYPHWAVFETIVDDLHDYSRYVEFHAANFKTFSVHLTRLYLSICSEIDVVLKMIFTELGQTKKRPD